MKFHCILTILNNYFDQFYWYSISKAMAIAVGKIQEFMLTIQGANEILTYDMVETAMIGCKIFGSSLKDLYKTVYVLGKEAMKLS